MKKLSLLGIIQVATIGVILFAYIALLAKYGSTPISETPVWVLWLLGR